MTATLHLVCGLPGSGKTTFAKALAEKTKAIRLSPDEWMSSLGMHIYDEAARTRVEGLQWSLAQQLLAAGVSVILDNGFWSKSERTQYRETANRLGAESVVHYMQAEPAMLKQRVVQRNASRAAHEHVDPNDIDGWVKLFEPPSNDELA